jgi:tyrosinase
MIVIKRRSMIGGALGSAALSIVPFETWFATEAQAAGPVMTRYDVASPQGQAMLTKYRTAVQMMMAAPPSSPCSWQFQWYTHFVKGSTTKAAEIAAIYPGGAPPADKALAQAMWNTCQAHSGGQDENMFLPWHRMFVYYFESIVRKVLNDPSFTLPYWNYSATATRAMPAAFRVVGSPLYRATRNPGPNAGASIPAGSVALPGPLAQTTYGPSGAAQGFNATLDFGLHGNVHVWVGNSQGMGSVPWAANDPIFWMHHCNIDRLWASWNKAGRPNPGGAWLNQTFIFADARCRQVIAKVGNVDQIAKLNYTYDRFEPVPGAVVTSAARTAMAPVLHLQAAAGAIALGSGPVRVTMQRPTAAPPNVRAFAAASSALGPSKSVLLVLDNVTTDLQPDVLYDVYLDLPADTAPNPDEPNYAATINFFSASHPHAEHGPEPLRRSFSLDVSHVVRDLATTGKLTDTPTVTIVPSGTPNAAAKPVIGGVRIVEQ